MASWLFWKYNYPGTTEEIIVKELQNNGFNVGTEVFVGYSPEREDPGNKKYSNQMVLKWCQGYKKCTELCVKLYQTCFDSTVTVSSLKAAEMCKLLENIHRSVNIGLVNELKPLMEKMNLDIFEIIDAAATKPLDRPIPRPRSRRSLYPNRSILSYVEGQGLWHEHRPIELIGEINSSMPNYAVQTTVEALNSINKSVKNSRILVLGLMYKKNVDDIRESPSLPVCDKLCQWAP